MKRFFICAAALAMTMATFVSPSFAAKAMDIKVDKIPSVGRLEEQKGTIIEVREGEKDSWSENRTFELKLTSDIKWNEKTTINGKKADIDGSSIKFTMKTNKDFKDMFYIIPYFDIERNANLGDLSVLIDDGNGDSQVVNIAKISDYAAALSSSFERVSKNSEFDAEVTVSEVVENSLIGNSLYDLEFDNATIVADSVKVKNAKGDDKLSIEEQKDNYITFKLDKKSDTPNKWTVSLKLKPNANYEGDITAKFSGKGVDTAETVVANAVEALDLQERKADVIELGKQNQKLSDIVIVEKQPSALKKGTYRLVLNPQYKGLKFKAPDVKAISGDARVGNVALDGNDIEFTVRGESIEPSTITISGLEATIDQFGYDGDYKFSLINKDDPKTVIKEIVLFTVNPEQKQEVTDTKDKSIVFAIGGLDYTVAGETKKLDVAPYISDGRTLLPVRVLAESLNTKVDWNAKSRTATLTTEEGKVLTITLGEKNMLVDGKSVALDVPAEVKESRTFLPMRAIVEALGAKVDWSASAKTATITK